MPGRIRLQHALADLELIGLELLEGDGAGLRRIRLPVHVHAHAVLVPGHRPEAAVRRGLLVPGDRLLASQVIEPFVGDALDVAVGVREIDLAQVHARHGHARTPSTPGTPSILVPNDLAPQPPVPAAEVHMPGDGGPSPREGVEDLEGADVRSGRS